MEATVETKCGLQVAEPGKMYRPCPNQARHVIGPSNPENGTPIHVCDDHHAIWAPRIAARKSEK